MAFQQEAEMLIESRFMMEVKRITMCVCVYALDVNQFLVFDGPGDYR
jgi:hypothetical protein